MNSSGELVPVGPSATSGSSTEMLGATSSSRIVSWPSASPITAPVGTDRSRRVASVFSVMGSLINVTGTSTVRVPGAKVTTIDGTGA